MEKYSGEALGFIETIGMGPALAATDIMLKASDVELVSYENIGSTLVTVTIRGDIAAVRSSVEAGAEAASKIGELTAQNVIPRPVKGVEDIISVHDINTH